MASSFPRGPRRRFSKKNKKTQGYEWEDDPDGELQEALALGILKPGLNIEEGDPYINNEQGLHLKLNDIYLNLPWIQRLDLNSKPAPMAPELALKMDEEKENVTKGKTNNALLNDFEREMTFHRQAQAAVIEGLRRLKELNIPTKRPDDYFAQMVKTDAHMQKVRVALTKKKAAVERSEKVRKIRQMRKINKQLEKQARVKKVNEKKEFLDQVKKFRQKVTDDLDFIDDKPKPKPKTDLTKVKKHLNRRAQRKKKLKEMKYSYGGKKKGSKRNNEKTIISKKGGFKGSFKKGGGGGGMKGKMKRPGKTKRSNVQSKQRSKHGRQH